MFSRLKQRRSELFLIAACVLLCAAYFFCFVNRAAVEVTIEVDKRTYLRVYWADEGENFSAARHSRVFVSPDQRDYRFYLTDIGSVERLRLDPHDYKGVSTIRRFVISQKGWQPTALIGGQTAALDPGEQVEAFTMNSAGLKTVSSGRDPQFVWAPSFERDTFGWPAEIARLLAFFLLLYLGGKLASGLFHEKKYIPLYLTVAAALIIVMAVGSKKYVHPDEFVHIQAAEYYTDHWLPPDIADEDIRHTYSKYGNSRLNGNEIYYLIAGKFAALTQSLPIPDNLKFRTFNIMLFITAVFIAVRYTDSRLVMAVLLISPQLWYVYSYCNSDAFALWVSILAGWQVVDRNSVLNRFIADGFESVNPLHVLLPVITIGLLFLIKKNYYPLGVFLGGIVCFRLWLNRDNLDIRQMGMRFFIVFLIGLSFPIVKTGLDYGVNGIDRNEKIESMRQELADPLFNPATELDKRHAYLDMKERGVTLNKIITVHRWFEKSFRSAFGVYGHMTVQATHAYYDLVRWLILVLFVFVAGSVLIWGDWPERCIMIAAVCCAAGLIGASLHHSWTADFQAQGRYLFPAALIIAIAAAYAEHRVNERMLCLLLTLMFAVAGYSLIGVAFVNMSRIA